MNSPVGQPSTQTPHQTTRPPRMSRAAKVIWAMLALSVAFVTAGIEMPAHVRLPVQKFVVAWLGGTILGYTGARLGDMVRRDSRPDVIVTTGSVSDALWARICWSIGPQIVGLYLGAVTQTSILARWIA